MNRGGVEFTLGQVEFDVCFLEPRRPQVSRNSPIGHIQYFRSQKLLCRTRA